MAASIQKRCTSSMQCLSNPEAEAHTRQRVPELARQHDINTATCSVCLDPYIGQRLVQCTVCNSWCALGVARALMGRRSRRAPNVVHTLLPGLCRKVFRQCHGAQPPLCKSRPASTEPMIAGSAKQKLRAPMRSKRNRQAGQIGIFAIALLKLILPTHGLRWKAIW